MTFGQNILILFFALTLNLSGQDSLLKKNSLGLGVSYSGVAKTPDFAKTIGVFYKHRRHQVFVGADIYSVVHSTGTIAGFQASYQFCLNKPARHVNAFAFYSFQYVQFGEGTVWAVPYNFLPTDDRRDYNLWRTQSLTNVCGLRVACDFLKVFSAYGEIGGGFNYSKRVPSPTNQYYKIDLNIYPQTNLIFTPCLKVGLNFKMYNW